MATDSVGTLLTPDDADGSRPQDAGRKHSRRGRPSAESVALLERYQGAMRTELEAVLVEIAGAPAPPGLLPEGEAPVMRPALKDRAALWDLAIKLGRELGASIDPTPVASSTTAGKARRRRVEW